ncbi:hypothetical protein THF1C08_50140 [Vibrio jasicida]|uniref:Exonuclease domain-containing protein n=1 Tax=Vibrio jasicida TaxID=766224 RepID=A0AAU9QU59_9VIBR|nr:hypothetical protein THF1C08_50140 [Vibrio jasicida]CAH1601767.1 hypothetical protein THF1A12_50207 [Vibrio jasicida]
MKKLEISRLAQTMIKEDVLVLDAEMTSRKQRSIISLSVVSSKTGTVLMDTLIASKFDISEEAFGVHGITNNDLVDAPTFLEVWRELELIRDGRQLTSFMTEADFDAIEFTLAHEAGVQESDLMDVDVYTNPLLQYIGNAHPVAVSLKNEARGYCIQKLFTDMYGTRYGNKVGLHAALSKINSNYQGAAHTAKADALAALKVLSYIAEFESRMLSKST